jgi:hypothetical protein
VRCRQLEKILFPPELAILLAELGQFNPLIASELTLIRGTEITPITADLSDPLGQAADGGANSLGHSPAAEVFTQAELKGLLLLLRRELAS